MPDVPPLDVYGLTVCTDDAHSSLRMTNLGLSNFDMHPRYLLNLFVYSTSTNGLLLWYMAVYTSRLKLLIVLTRANDYDASRRLAASMANDGMGVMLVYLYCVK